MVIIREPSRVYWKFLVQKVWGVGCIVPPGGTLKCEFLGAPSGALEGGAPLNTPQNSISMKCRVQAKFLHKLKCHGLLTKNSILKKINNDAKSNQEGPLLALITHLKYIFSATMKHVSKCTLNCADSKSTAWENFKWCHLWWCISVATDAQELSLWV